MENRLNMNPVYTKNPSLLKPYREVLLFEVCKRKGRAST